MSFSTCKCCGQILPQQLKLTVRLRPGPRRIAELVYRAGPNGIPTDVLFDHIYRDDPDGGPLGGKNVLAARITMLNRRLKVDGLRIRGTRGRGENVYIWEKL